MKTNLHVLFISRSSLFNVKGGDTIQIQNTAIELEKLGVKVDIKLSNDLFIDYKKYILIHFFNIIRPADMLLHISKSKLPYVVSTIYVDYSEYEKNNISSVKDKILNIISSDVREYIKAIARWIVNGERIISKRYIWLGHKKSIQKIITGANLLLPNSESEYHRLLQSYGVKSDYSIIPNAADTFVFNYDAEQQSKRNAKMILCVARIEGRKNQLNLIRALNNTEFELYIVGKAAPNHQEYFEQCKFEAASNIFFVDEISQDKLVDFYQKANVHILPSWFETTGLSSLEALFCGCNIVVTEYGDTRDYFPEENIFYCNPNSIQSIYKAVHMASTNKINFDFIARMKAAYNWENTASKTLDAYNRVIGNT
jgi:glycosyltransferase involved in cell wall biosynthesis